MEKLTSSDLQAFMRQRAIPGEILRLSVPTPTVETAAQAVGCQPEQIVKSILFFFRIHPSAFILHPSESTLLDRRVLQHPLVYAGGGDENALVRLDPQDILRASGAEVLDLTNLTPSAPSSLAGKGAAIANIAGGGRRDNDDDERDKP